MEWILILSLATGTVTVPRPFPNEESCIGAGEKALPPCTAALGLFDRVNEVCFPRRFVCVPQPRIIPRRPPNVIRAAPISPPTTALPRDGASGKRQDNLNCNVCQGRD